MDNDGVDKVIEAFRNRDNFLITAHVNPEGDSIGSQLAVYYILKRLGKRAVMADHDDVPENLKFLPGSESITREIPKDFRLDTVIVLDCPVRDRIGRISDCIDERPFIVNIDHHVSNGFFGNVNWVDREASSVGEMIFHLAEKMGIEIEKDPATALYTAIITDTGMFNYDNTSKETHRAAGELIAAGVNPKAVHAEIFEKKSISEIRLLGRALTTLQLEEGGALAHMSLTRKMYSEEGVDRVSTDEFINFPRSIKGVEVAVFFKEDGITREEINVSFRSSGRVNVNIVAAHFGGGGHALAAGCTLNCGLEEARDKVLGGIRKALGVGA
ncbi:MAG: bifunctional oligoribonuclease/PAP phosphatase NrnA [Candidatus Makaraimicrobium thalassicum]|nr:MAG: bifunctional oligoribonuclease/PAP phosphatase NrnA [Candidatus Omnitrophota bacterium]